MINEVFYILHTKSEIWCVYYTYNTSQFRLANFKCSLTTCGFRGSSDTCPALRSHSDKYISCCIAHTCMYLLRTKKKNHLPLLHILHSLSLLSCSFFLVIYMRINKFEVRGGVVEKESTGWMWETLKEVNAPGFVTEPEGRQ